MYIKVSFCHCTFALFYSLTCDIWLVEFARFICSSISSCFVHCFADHCLFLFFMPLGWLYSLCFAIIDFRFEISKVWILHSLSFDGRLAFHFGISLLPLGYFLFSPIVPFDNSLMSSNYSFGVFFSDYPFGFSWVRLWSHWTLCWYLQITPLGASDYTFDIFWLHLWYILIIPFISSDYTLISSDYTFDIFWLHLWYLLITPLVYSDYTCGIFWLPPLVSPDYHLGIFWLPLCYLLINPLVFSNVLCGGHWDCQDMIIWEI